MTVKPPQRERLLLVTRNLPPLQGGMERLNWHLLQQLQRVVDVQAVGPVGAANLAPAGAQMREAPLHPLWGFMLTAFWHCLALGLRRQPSLYLAGSGLTAPHAWITSRLLGGRSVAYLHGLDITVDNVVYRRLWLPILRRLDMVIVNSSATATLAIEAGIAPARIHRVHPGVSLPQVPSPARRMEEGRAFRIKHALGEGVLLLSAGRLTPRKGLLEFVRDSFPAILQAHPHATLVIIGGAAGQALGSEMLTPDQILANATPVVRSNIHFIGKVSDEELAVAMHSAAVHVFPVRSQRSDPEGFGMVAIEAAAHGLPTVAYASGGVVDAVAAGISGTLIAPGDSCAFADAVIEMIHHPLPPAPMRIFASAFDWDVFGRQVCEVLGVRDQVTQ